MLRSLVGSEMCIRDRYSPSDGTIDPAGVVQAYSREAKRMGAVVAEKTGLGSVEHDGRGKICAVVTECGQRIETGRVVNAAGCWANEVAEKAGIPPLPLVAMKHAMIVTDQIEGMHPGLPNVRDHDLSVYFKTQGDSMCLGGYEKNPAFWPDVDPQFAFGLFDLDFDTFGQNLEGHMTRCPVSAEAGIKSTVCGPESFTPDHQPLVGPDPSLNGLWHCCGFNSMGMMLGGGVGAELATWMVEGSASKDMFGMDVARFHPDCTSSPDWVLHSTHESYAKTYAIAFPHDEHLAGRKQRRSPLYHHLLEAGCVFQGRHGFERPGYFSHQGPAEPKEYDFSGAYHEQGEVTGLGLEGVPRHPEDPFRDAVEGECTFSWRESFAAVQQEARAARTGAAVFDQSYFGKFLLTGRDAVQAAEWLATAPIGDREIGSVVYTALCNARGGVQADLTITRDSDDRFYIASGGSTATQDKRWINTVIEDQGFAAELEDVSDDYAILSIQGPYSRTLLQMMAATQADTTTIDDLKFSHATDLGITIDGSTHQVRCMRLTFVGELGFELHAHKSIAGNLYSTLMAAGEELSERDPEVVVRNAGYHCIDSLSAEKGYRHWHADLSNADTPMEAGIGFVATKKLKSGPNFLGRDALLQQKAEGLQRKLVCLTVEAQNLETGDWMEPLNGNETIWKDGECVGLVRSTAYGPTLNKTIAYGYVDLSPDQGVRKVTNKWLSTGSWQIGSVGEKIDATLHLKAPFDPQNLRVKGEYENVVPDVNVHVELGRADKREERGSV
eukprot:TRINITY_DN9698_c0_g1_i3.p1 TRINITY_DN9698_c0_g1~~TRINITY_DN9698_c0_g1_i3.p1  ORF type:complete len:803 (+),score=208.91 TRINITY_DN9698_c0_g1_i3:64-2409(+)